MTRNRVILLVALLFGTAAPLSAQNPAPAPQGDQVGRIVAIVGDSIILNYDIDEGIYSLEAQAGRALPRSGPEYEQLREQVLNAKINELLLVQAAAQDTTIRIAEEQLRSAVQAEIDRNQQRLGGVVAFEQALRESGLSMDDYRARLSVQIRKRALIEQYRNRVRAERKAPPVTEQELRAAYEQQKAQLPLREPTITFQQVVVRTTPADSALATAKARADSVLEALRDGAEFEALARRYNPDATRDRGGDLGWIRRGDMLPAFAEAAFSLRPGQVSAPVLTQVGYHIIRVDRVRGAEISARHILIQPVLTEADAARAREQADTVAARLRAGMNADTLADLYGPPDQQVRIGPVTLAELQQRAGIDASTASAGDVLGPVAVGVGEIPSEFMVVRVLEREAQRPWTLEDPDLRREMQRIVETQKLDAEIVEDLRRSMYVEVRGF